MSNKLTEDFIIITAFLAPFVITAIYFVITNRTKKQ